jgi:hypothetical protein
MQSTNIIELALRKRSFTVPIIYHCPFFSIKCIRFFFGGHQAYHISVDLVVLHGKYWKWHSLRGYNYDKHF